MAESSATATPVGVMEKIEANIKYLTDDIIHGSLVDQFSQFDDGGESLQQLQDELLAVIIGKFGYPDEAISLPHP